MDSAIFAYRKFAENNYFIEKIDCIKYKKMLK